MEKQIDVLTKQALNNAEIIKIIADVFLPVDSVISNKNGVNPGTYILGTTWEPFAPGRTLVGVGTSDKEFGADEQGGESSHKLNINEVPSHNHIIDRQSTWCKMFNMLSNSYNNGSIVEGGVAANNSADMTESPGYTPAGINVGGTHKAYNFTFSMDHDHNCQPNGGGILTTISNHIKQFITGFVQLKQLRRVYL